MLYEELEASKEKRLHDQEIRKINNAGLQRESKPDKKQRRQIRQFKERN